MFKTLAVAPWAVPALVLLAFAAKANETFPDISADEVAQLLAIEAGIRRQELPYLASRSSFSITGGSQFSWEAELLDLLAVELTTNEPMLWHDNSADVSPLAPLVPDWSNLIFAGGDVITLESSFSFLPWEPVWNDVYISGGSLSSSTSWLTLEQPTLDYSGSLFISSGYSSDYALTWASDITISATLTVGSMMVSVDPNWTLEASELNFDTLTNLSLLETATAELILEGTLNSYPYTEEGSNAVGVLDGVLIATPLPAAAWLLLGALPVLARRRSIAANAATR